MSNNGVYSLKQVMSWEYIFGITNIFVMIYIYIYIYISCYVMLRIKN